MHQNGDDGAQAKNKAFGEKFKAGVLEGNWAEIIGFVCPGFLGEENNIGLINRPKISLERVDVLKRRKKRVFNEILVFL